MMFEKMARKKFHITLSKKKKKANENMIQNIR